MKSYVSRNHPLRLPTKLAESKLSLLLLFSLLILSSAVKAQSENDSLSLFKEYKNIDEALKNPSQVYKLDLSNQEIVLADTVWHQFTNLKYLSLKNDRLKEIPAGIGNLQNLEVLDLSGNDFKSLPSNFNKLTNLQELYLNDEKNFELAQNIDILSTLPKLKSLHIENDNLTSLPKNINKLNHLELLYLNSNQFNQIPAELKEIKTLRFVDFQNNSIHIPSQERENKAVGFKIRF